MKILWRHIQNDLITLKLTANFNNGFFLDVRNSFLNKITRFYYTLKNTKARELQKYIRADTTQRFSKTDIKLTRVG